MKWRYQSNIEQKYLFFCLRENKKLVALAVATIFQKEMVIAEIFSSKKDIELGRFLLFKIMRWSFKDSLKKINFSGKDDGFFKLVFDVFYTQPGKLKLCIKILNDPELERRAMLPNNWSSTAGDLDSQ